MHDQSLIRRLLWLFKANIIISCLAVGGGYMIIPLMKKQFIDKARAFDFDELIEMYAIAQSAPGAIDRKSTRLNSSHVKRSRMPSSA